MYGRGNRLAVAALVVAGVVLVAPAAALACGGGPSAVNVYKECLPSGGGGGSGGPTSQGPSSPNSGNGSSPPVSSRTLQALAHAGKDKSALTALVEGYGLQRQLHAVHASEAAAPSALGSAFDLGSGPTVLLIVLAGTAALLLGGSGLRGWRSRPRP